MADVASRHGGAQVGTEDLLLSMLSDRECVAVKLIMSQNASIGELQADIMSFFEITAGFSSASVPQKSLICDCHPRRALASPE